jgi:hypothetical protein
MSKIITKKQLNIVIESTIKEYDKTLGKTIDFARKMTPVGGKLSKVMSIIHDLVNLDFKAAKHSITNKEGFNKISYLFRELSLINMILNHINKNSCNGGNCLRGMNITDLKKPNFNELVEYGFIELIEKSKNQYSSNIIALSNNFKALDKALDKAFIKHTTKQDGSTIQSTGESISSIDIQETTIQETNLQDEIVFNFKTALLELGIETKIVLEWLQVRKKKKLTNSETAFNSIKKEIQKSGLTPNECIKIAVEKSWGGIDAEWLEKYKPKPEENFFTKMGIPR